MEDNSTGTSDEAFRNRNDNTGHQLSTGLSVELPQTIDNETTTTMRNSEGHDSVLAPTSTFHCGVAITKARPHRYVVDYERQSVNVVVGMSSL